VIAENLVIERGISAGDAWVTVDPEKIKQALQSLKDDGYRLLVFLTCVDHLADASRVWAARYELIYQLRNLETKDQVRVRAFVDGDPPHIDSVHDVFPPAYWDERETCSASSSTTTPT
jgi:NADH:ubiquinone oxidoreductase subunit C